MINDELTQAWATLTAQLADAGEQVEALSEGHDPTVRAEGYRFLTRILVGMTEFQVEQDADAPSLVQVMSPIPSAPCDVFTNITVTTTRMNLKTG